MILDGELRVTRANRAFYDTFQIAPSETENRPVDQLGGGEWNLPKLRAKLEEVFKEGTSFDHFEFKYTERGIGSRTVRLSARQIAWKGAGPAKAKNLLLEMEDLSKRKTLEQNLRQFLEFAPDAMVVVDIEGHIQWVNNQAERLFGYSESALLGKPVEVLIPASL